MRRHPLDPFSLVFGLTFVALGGLFLNTRIDLGDLAAGGWVPLPLVFLGLLVLAIGLSRAQKPSSPPDETDDKDASDEGSLTS